MDNKRIADNSFKQGYLQKSDVLKHNLLWDKNIADLLVTNTDERTMELGATFSAKNASDMLNLRCEVREQLINYIQENHPYGLPKLRRIEVGKA